MIGQTGIWTTEESDYGHAFSYYTARFIGRYFEKNRPVIDLGCGNGTYLQYLKDIGFENLTGVDGCKVSKPDFEDIQIIDLAQPINVGKGNVLSLEVFEHIPPMYERQFVQNIINSCDDKLVLSVAVEGQGGIGHVNCKNNDYIINLFSENGFSFKEGLTDAIRTDVEPHVMYFKNTLMIFEKIK